MKKGRSDHSMKHDEAGRGLAAASLRRNSNISIFPMASTIHIRYKTPTLYTSRYILLNEIIHCYYSSQIQLTDLFAIYYVSDIWEQRLWDEASFVMILDH